MRAPIETRTTTTTPPAWVPNTRSLRRRVAVALLGLGALGTVACGTQAAPLSPQLQQSPQQQVSAGAMAVNCGAGQQAIIRPATMNGQAVSQVDCVPAGVLAGEAPPPVYAAPSYTAPAYVAPAPMAAASVGVVPVSYGAARAVSATEYVAYHPRVIKRARPRSVRKSAVIIGSSAGIGAAIGGAIKGGKGALIGAAIGGGGAALWDQATRHDR